MVAQVRALAGEAIGLGGLVERVKATLNVWGKRIEERRTLAQLTFREIQEIGIDQAALDAEIAKPFWRE